jgi:regulatory protein
VEITDIKRQKHHGGRFSIYVDGKYAFSLDSVTLTGSGLHIGDTISDEKLKVLSQKDEFFRARDYAYSLLSYRERTEYEMKKRLFEKGFSTGVVRGVLDMLKAKDLINDRSFARKWVDDVLLHRPMGKLRIQHELRKRRVSEDVIDEVCQLRLESDAEVALARCAAEKKLHVLENYPPDTQKRRLYGFLKNRGFDFGVIHDLMKEYFGDYVQ